LVDEFLGRSELVVQVRSTPDPAAAGSDPQTVGAGAVLRREDGRPIRSPIDWRRYTTTELLGVEEAMIAAAVRRQQEQVGVVPERVVDAALQVHATTQRTLAGEQVAMVRALTQDGAGVAVVCAKAGTGKTTTLSACRWAWATAGYRVTGAALTAHAAKELEDGAGIPSQTISKFLAALEDMDAGGWVGGFGPQTVVVVDEAGMVGTRQLAQLLDYAERAGAKVVLVGDPEQLQAIDAGGGLRGLARRLGAVTLTENHRQRARWEVEALDLLRGEDAEAAIAHYQQHGRVVTARTATQVRERLVADWWAAMRQPEAGAGERPPVMVALRRSDVADLNQGARALLAAEGQLGTDTQLVGEREFAVGDRVVTLRNARRWLGVLNGTRATVTALDPERGGLTVQTDDGHSVYLPRSYLSPRARWGGMRLDHAYAVTGHKVQGITTERAFVLGSDELYREWGYVALSRGTIWNCLYLVVGEQPLAAEIDLPVEARPEPVATIVNALGRSRAETLAVDHGTAATAAAASSAELEARVAAAARLLEARPTGAAGELVELRAMRSRLQRYLQEELAYRSGRDGGQTSAGTVTSPERRRLVDRLRRRAPGEDGPVAMLEHLQRQLAQFDQRIEQTKVAVDQAATWQTTNAEQLRQALADIGELSHRDQALALQLAHDPPAHAVAALGGRPADPKAQAIWGAAAVAVERYRQRHDVDAPSHPLADKAGTARQCEEKEALAKLIERAVEQINTAERGVLDRGIAVEVESEASVELFD